MLAPALTALLALASAAPPQPPRPSLPRDAAEPLRPNPRPDASRAPARKLTFNGRPLVGAQWQTLARLERHIGTLPDGAYWYDPRCGASGRWGGPTLAFLPAGLELGGPLPAEASGGGSGALTGVFINGRELDPVDVAGLREALGQVWPGRWWVDAQGNWGAEGNALPMGNLVAAARQRGQGRQAWSKRYEGATPGGSMNLASDGTTTCVSVSGYSRCTGE
ncbi:MAG: hypothetical protein HZB56_20020 [Deltaproteobacteria bacterium]|nr:hypothetical protein [Deltaproteobacteria bacterium]